MIITENSEIPESKNRVPLAPLRKKLGKLKRLKILVSIPLIFGVFLIIYAGFGLAYFQKQAEAKDMESQIALQRTILRKPASSFDVEQLQTELALKEGEVALKRQEIVEFLMALPKPEQSIDIYDSLVDLSRKTDLKWESEDVTLRRIAIGGAAKDESGGSMLAFLMGILSVDEETGDTASPDPVTADLSEASGSGDILPYLSYSLQMEGSLSALLDFTSSLAEGKNMLGGMELMSISLTEAGTNPDNETALYALKLDIRVHTWPEVPSENEETDVAPEVGE